MRGQRKGVKCTETRFLVFCFLIEVCMTTETARDSSLGSLMEKDPMLRQMPNVALALHLLLEKNSPCSFWEPYINVLPRWNIEEKSQFIRLIQNYRLDNICLLLWAGLTFSEMQGQSFHEKDLSSKNVSNQNKLIMLRYFRDNILGSCTDYFYSPIGVYKTVCSVEISCTTNSEEHPWPPSQVWQLLLFL